MTEENMELLSSLAKVTDTKLGDIYEVVDENDLVDAAGKLLKFVHISSNIQDQIYMFWKLRHEKSLDDGCYVVFTDINKSLHWQDLIEIYHGTMFGTMFLVRFTSNTRAKICPSQRGMYIK